ncbi:MAG: sulfotransferase [Chloroflexota bacterium]|nr:sulfotransferase [Chloroflexota bacterium]
MTTFFGEASSLITIIGRGHSGTRAISHTLSESGVFMGEPLNASGDLLPPRPMYDACRVFATYVRWNGGLEWDFSPAIDAAIPPEFAQLIETYLTSVLSSDARHKGWKIPETTLVFPWICRLFPAAKYVFWIRDPRDAILGYHLTDDLRDFGVDYAETDDERIRRAISWKYQFDLVQATPRPDNWIEVRFEDFVLNQEETLARLADFLGFELAQIPVRPQSVGRWQMAEGTTSFGFLAPAMHEYRYFNPDQSVARKEEI